MPGSSHGPNWQSVKVCVRDVLAKGSDVDNAFAVCEASINGTAEEATAALEGCKLDETVKAEVGKYLAGVRSEILASVPVVPKVFIFFSRTSNRFESDSSAAPLGHRFWKEIFREGDYVHPQDSSEDLAIDESRMSQWVKNFDGGAMEKVMVTYSHPKDGVELIENAHGFVAKLEIRRANGLASLWALIDVDAETANKIKQGLIASVSVGVQERTSNTGKPLGEILQHLALTNDPYITHMDTFKVAAESATSKVIRLESRRVQMDYSKLSHAQVGHAYAAFKAGGDTQGTDSAGQEMQKRHDSLNPGVAYPGHDQAAANFQAIEAGVGPTVQSKAAAEAEAKAQKLSVELEAVKKSTEAEVKRVNAIEAENIANRTILADMKTKLELAAVAEVKARVEGWENAKYGLPKDAAARVSAIMLASRKTSFECEVKTDKGEEKMDLAVALSAVLDAVTQTGLVNHTRASSLNPGKALGGPSEGGDEPESFDAQFDAYVSETKAKAFDMSVPMTKWAKEEKARYTALVSKGVAENKIKYQNPTSISR